MRRQAMVRYLALGVLAFLFASAAHSQTPATQPTPETLSIPPDSPRWDLQGNAKVTEHQGRQALMLNGAQAIVKNFEMRDAVLDVDVSTPASRGFFGFYFRLTDDGANTEFVYLRQHKSGRPDAMQYIPVLNNGRTWQIYNGPGFTGAVDIPKDQWFHLRLEVVGAQAKLYVKDMEKPALVMDDLKSGNQKGQLGMFVLAGETYISNFQVRTTPDAPWERHLPPMPPNILAKWALSPAYEVYESSGAPARNLERPLTPSEIAATKWQDVEAEPPGFVVINRYRESPQFQRSYDNDFSKRLEPQPGMRVVYARTTIESDRDQLKRFNLGYSDAVSVFLNGKILYRGQSYQNYRDPDFLGIINLDNDYVYLPLKQGSNDLVLAVSEIGGGWAFICRLDDIPN
jgi:hypothetical protein